MSRRNLQRFPSLVFDLHDDDDDDHFDHDQTNDSHHSSIDVQYSTPRASSQPKIQSQNITSTIVTTNQLLASAAVGLSTPSPRRPAIKRRAHSVTPSRKTNQDIAVIDLITPPKPFMTTTRTIQPNYMIRTLSIYNQRRRSILPTFPSMTYTHEPDLLLANIPLDVLSTQELTHRQPSLYPASFQIRNPHPPAGSFMMTQYQKYFIPILERFKMDTSILDHNYFRLHEFMNLFRSSRLRQLGQKKSAEDLLPLGDTEIPQLFEFYLQMDVDLFYMKTCSYHGAQPRSIHEGIFCLETPQCLYTMSKCNQCELCIPTDNTLSALFDNYNRHRFVNGYESILNCPVDCNTKNFIYVLTCACHEFDYICETKFSLGRRLQDHRQIANNLIRKLLFGKENFKTIPLNKELASIISNKGTMQLYQHTSQCSKAIQLLLDENPTYWPFVPKTTIEVNQDDAHYHRMHATTTDKSRFNQNESTTRFLNNIPVPPHGFKFSQRQIEQQIQFFQTNKLLEPFHDQVNIYNGTIIAVLPPNTTDLFRRMVHSLFVTHTEAKLNTLGHLFSLPQYHTIRNGLWCANLKHPHPNF
ncbi:unnamed protein product [Rotaria magnacalcarata]|uniref:Uncharacterized protein n=1 Tax=Rotaria magnacalcarata TaxID=392030 RepID=A0A819KEI4_9BILA|nr:unnamed protein product [Rotaria magnacalcarata]CAF3948232.1 unnamed protein product [Rotaria magnacalcarata]